MKILPPRNWMTRIFRMIESNYEEMGKKYLVHSVYLVNTLPRRLCASAVNLLQTNPAVRPLQAQCLQDSIAIRADRICPMR